MYEHLDFFQSVYIKENISRQLKNGKLNGKNNTFANTWRKYVQCPQISVDFVENFLQKMLSNF
jgi:hypothetical protein